MFGSDVAAGARTDREAPHVIIGVTTMTRYIALPRYFVCLLPFLMIAFATALCSLAPLGRISLFAVVCLIEFNLLNRSAQTGSELTCQSNHLVQEERPSQSVLAPRSKSARLASTLSIYDR